jgi:hypothetical protein
MHTTSISLLKSLGGPATPAPAVPDESRTRFLAPPQCADEIGRLGSYWVLQVLGSGGMGIVYLAEDTRLQRPVALKVLRPTLAEDVRTRQRFLQEARVMLLSGSVLQADKRRYLIAKLVSVETGCIVGVTVVAPCRV